MKEKFNNLFKILMVYFVMSGFSYIIILLIGFLTTFNIHFWEWKIFSSWGFGIGHIIFNIQLLITSKIYVIGEFVHEDEL